MLRKANVSALYGKGKNMSKTTKAKTAPKKAAKKAVAKKSKKSVTSM